MILVASLTHNTGNRTTAFRVAHQLVRALSARHGDREACDHGADVDTVKQHDEVFAETQAIVFSSSVANCLVLDVHKVNTSGMLSSASQYLMTMCCCQLKATSLRNVVASTRAGLVVGIHAVRAGRLIDMAKLSIPCVVIVGGEAVVSSSALRSSLTTACVQGRKCALRPGVTRPSWHSEACSLLSMWWCLAGPCGMSFKPRFPHTRRSCASEYRASPRPCCCRHELLLHQGGYIRCAAPH